MLAEQARVGGASSASPTVSAPSMRSDYMAEEALRSLCEDIIWRQGVPYAN
jgi:hypothetical protein